MSNSSQGIKTHGFFQPKTAKVAVPTSIAKRTTGPRGQGNTRAATAKSQRTNASGALESSTSTNTSNSSQISLVLQANDLGQCLTQLDFHPAQIFTQPVTDLQKVTKPGVLNPVLPKTISK